MSSPAGTVVDHPLVDFAARLHAALDRLTDTPCWSMTAGELQTTIVELTRGDRTGRGAPAPGPRGG